MIDFIDIQSKIIKNNKNAIKILKDEEKEFLQNYYPHATSIQECIWMCKNNISENDVPRCEICGKRAKWLNGRKKHNMYYSYTCGNIQCQNKLKNNKLKQATLEKYGVDNYGLLQRKPKHVKTFEEIYEINKIRIQHMKDTMLKKYGATNSQQVLEIKEKTKQTLIELYGGIGNASKELQQKQKETMIKRYGVKNAMHSDDIKERIKQTNIERYGCNWAIASNDIKEKIIQANILKYGVEHYNNPEKIKQTMYDIYGCYGNFGRDSVKEKIFDVCLLKYNNGDYNNTNIAELKNFLLNNGVKWFSQIPGVIDKIQQTKRKNGTFNTSRPEEEVYQLLQVFFNKEDIHRQYTSKAYPFHCDFYIESIDTYIECNFSWTHGGHFYNEQSKEDNERLLEMIDKHTEYYDNAVQTWSIRDVAKLKAATENNLNYIVFWNLEEAYYYALYLHYSDDALQKEYNLFKTKDGVCENNCIYNKIVKQFQQDTFFAKEKELFMYYPEIRNKLTENRKKYLHKDTFTVDELLMGFKRSGIHYSYSHFNPLLFKWFIQQYNIKTCYDPCGGWGHRLLGAFDLDLYIYNDLSKSTKENVDAIINYFNIQNAITYCEDATTFRPTEQYEAMFTCPPYFNIEHYECGDFENDEAYFTFIDDLFDCFYSNTACRIFGLVIREDCLQEKWKNKVSQCYELKTNQHCIVGKKHKTEYLYIFEKNTK